MILLAAGETTQPVTSGTSAMETVLDLKTDRSECHLGNLRHGDRVGPGEGEDRSECHLGNLRHGDRVGPEDRGRQVTGEGRSSREVRGDAMDLILHASWGK